MYAQRKQAKAAQDVNETGMRAKRNGEQDNLFIHRSLEPFSIMHSFRNLKLIHASNSRFLEETWEAISTMASDHVAETGACRDIELLGYYSSLYDSQR